MKTNLQRGKREYKSDEQILNIKIDGNSAARIIVNIDGQDKVALIDTGAGRCCMNEEQYQTLGSPPLETCGCGVPIVNRLWSPNARDGFPYL